MYHLSLKTETIDKIDLDNDDEFSEIAQHINKNIDKAKCLIKNEEKIKEVIETNLQKDFQLMEQSKMANMGKMLNNIIHQWRQPLSTISTIASNVIVMKECAILDVEALPNDMQKIINNVQHLSETVNVFRNFLMEKKEKVVVDILERINLSLDIVSIALKDANISLKNEIDYSKPIKANIIAGELSEVIINIINNAKDVLVEKKISDPYIKLMLEKRDNIAIIIIEDNGGGIPDNIMPKIFDENFSTKDKKHGTGIGLYMSKKIMRESLDGDLYAKNIQNGVQFFIELPISF